MYPVAVAVALAIAASSASAVEPTASAPKTPLQLRPKAAIATMTPTHRFAPFVMPIPNEPDPELLPRRDERLDQSRSSCSGDRSLCYDPNSGRIVYKPARALMPDIPGLQRENISVKRDRIVLRYSF